MTVCVRIALNLLGIEFDTVAGAAAGGGVRAAQRMKGASSTRALARVLVLGCERLTFHVGGLMLF